MLYTINFDIMNQIPIVKDNKVHTKSFDQIIISRLRTQRRHATKYGGIGFNPPLISAVLKKYNDSTTFPNWINAILNTIFFEVRKGKVFLQEVEKIILISVPSQNITVTHFPIKKYKHLVPPKLKLFKVYIKTSKWKSHAQYRVMLGDKLNLASDIDDITLDHIVPIRRVLDDNKNKLHYLTEISYIEETSGTKVVKQICNNFNAPSALSNNIIKGIKNELNFIIKMTKGIRIRVKRVN